MRVLIVTDSDARETVAVVRMRPGDNIVRAATRWIAKQNKIAKRRSDYDPTIDLITMDTYQLESCEVQS